MRMMLSMLCCDVQYAAKESSGLMRHAWHGEQRGRRLVAFSLHAHVFVGTVGVTRSDPIVPLVNQILATQRILDQVLNPITKPDHFVNPTHFRVLS